MNFNNETNNHSSYGRQRPMLLEQWNSHDSQEHHDILTPLSQHRGQIFESPTIFEKDQLGCQNTEIKYQQNTQNMGVPAAALDNNNIAPCYGNMNMNGNMTNGGI